MVWIVDEGKTDAKENLYASRSRYGTSADRASRASPRRRTHSPERKVSRREDSRDRHSRDRHSRDRHSRAESSERRGRGESGDRQERDRSGDLPSRTSSRDRLEDRKQRLSSKERTKSKDRVDNGSAVDSRISSIGEIIQVLTTPNMDVISVYLLLLDCNILFPEIYSLYDLLMFAALMTCFLAYRSRISEKKLNSLLIAQRK